MVQHSVVVIGAGLSGLIVAYRLLQKGVDVHVYEARQRVGGRILTALLNDYPIEAHKIYWMEERLKIFKSLSQISSS